MTDQTTDTPVNSITDNAKQLVVKKSMALWQKFLLYPAVIGALFGAIPTTMDIYKAFKYDVSYAEVKHAEEQRGLWMKNFACTSDMNYQKVKTDQDVEVQVGACRNGDVLISVQQPDGKKVVEWVSIEKLRKASLISSILGSPAFATSLMPASRITRTRTGYNTPYIHQAANKVKTMCQKLESGTRIVRVVNENGACYRETVQLLKGTVSDRKKVACSTKCG